MAGCAVGVRMWLVGKAVPFHARHPELVSGSIVPHSPPVAAEKWTLERSHREMKQVQGDDAGLVG